MSKIAIMKEFWLFLRVRKKMVVGTDYYFPVTSGCFNCIYTRFGGSTIYLCTVLNNLQFIDEIYLVHLIIHNQPFSIFGLLIY